MSSNSQDKNDDIAAILIAIWALVGCLGFLT